MTERNYPTIASPMTEENLRAWRFGAVLTQIYFPIIAIDERITGHDLRVTSKRCSAYEGL